MEQQKQGQEGSQEQQVQVPKKEGELDRQEDVHTTRTTRIDNSSGIPVQVEKKVTTVKGPGGNYGRYTKVVSKSLDDDAKFYKREVQIISHQTFGLDLDQDEDTETQQYKQGD